jgi:hypothetical protein
MLGLFIAKERGNQSGKYQRTYRGEVATAGIGVQFRSLFWALCISKNIPAVQSDRSFSFRMRIADLRVTEDGMDDRSEMIEDRR